MKTAIIDIDSSALTLESSVIMTRRMNIEGNAKKSKTTEKRSIGITWVTPANVDEIPAATNVNPKITKKTCTIPPNALDSATSNCSFL